MMLGLAIVFIAFASLSAWTLKTRDLRSREAMDWIVDGLGLLMQGLVVPVVQTLLIGSLWGWMMPAWKGQFHPHPVVAFVLSFVLVDYLYYWNHRLLHTQNLWKWHRLHHTTQKMDLLASSRNSFFTPALIIYVWVNSLFVFLLGDATYFVVASSVGAALDLWRHSGFVLARDSKMYAALSPWLILPQDHEWHHAQSDLSVNFGANFNLWDRLHGTFHRAEERPQVFGTDEVRSLTWREFLWPRRGQQ